MKILKSLRLLFLAFVLGILWTGCATNADPSATSSVAVTMSAATTTGKTTIGGREATLVGLTAVTVNLREIEFDFDHEDSHFKKDSAYKDDKEAKLKGPFIVDLMNANGFVDQAITSIALPNANYEKISFRLAPSTAAGDMSGKSIFIKGTIATVPFQFWHKADVKFGAKFSDSTALAATGNAVKLGIHLELERILAVTNGGIDLSLAKDGDKNGTIVIDPLNTDGNKDLADAIMKLLARRTHCEKGK